MDEQMPPLPACKQEISGCGKLYDKAQMLAYAKEYAAAAAEPATKSEIELAWFHICGDYGNPLKLSALRTGRALDAVLQARAKATP